VEPRGGLDAVGKRKKSFPL